MSGLGITFSKGLYRDVLESDIPKLEANLKRKHSDGVDQVRYEIETFSLLGFQKYIQLCLMEILFSLRLKQWIINKKRHSIIRMSFQI